MTPRFTGQVALITGAGSGIGADAAELLSSEGCAVALFDRDGLAIAARAEAIGAAGGRAIAIAGDVTDRVLVDGAVTQTVSLFGRLDILVACAGILRDNLLFRLTDDDWDAVIDTHLKGTFLFARAAQAPMVAQRSGRMVFLSSIAALGLRGQSNYAAAKAGIQGLARTLAIELGPLGVTVNAVAPGFVDTPMTRAVAARLGVPWEKLEAEWVSQVPARRLARPRDIANVIAFLCSADAAYVSGQTIYVAGGPRG